MIKNILALDLGKTTLGVAISRSGMFVTPLKNFRFQREDYETALDMLEDLMKTEKVERIVIGYPSFPSGDPCEMSYDVEKFIVMLNERFKDIPVFKQDERYSTMEASSILHETNQNSRKQKKKIDETAASVILERYIEKVNG